MANILTAFNNLINNSSSEVSTRYSSGNRINNVGEGLEIYIKDMFSGAVNIDEDSMKMEQYQKTFSYLGNNNNPPDIMIRGGDALEVKKIQSINNGIALNSSHPKSKLYHDDSRISQECRDAEIWDVKDIIYTIGCVNGTSLKNIFFVYGDVYCAKRETYQKIAEAIKQGIGEIPDITFARTNELAKVNNVDPLGITSLRVRGMWHIMNPNRVFSYIDINTSHAFTALALMREEKYNSFPQEDRESLESLVNESFSILDVKVKNPDNPVDLISAKLLKFWLS